MAQIDWVGGAASGSAGPIVDFTNFFTNRGVLAGQADPVEAAGSAFFGVNYQDANTALVPTPSTWSNVPTGDPAAPPMEATWAVPSTSLPRTRTAPTTCTSTTASSVAGPPMTT